MQKPIDAEEMMFVLNKALTVVERRAEQPPPPSSHERAGIIGDSPTMRQVYATLERAAQGTATVLVRGESGTGKELAARAIHDASPRVGGAVRQDRLHVAAEHLLESELFGYEKGAFTGAVARKPGRAELADKGTLFLDEIGELSLPLQAKLLRLLQDRQIERLGGTKTIAVDVRVVAATHRDLEKHGRAATVSARSVLPLERGAALVAAAARSAVKTSTCWWSIFASCSGEPTASRTSVSIATRSRRCADSAGPATSANCRISSSAWSCSAMAR